MLKENKSAAKIINSCECLSRTKDKGSSMLLKVKLRPIVDILILNLKVHFNSLSLESPHLGWADLTTWASLDSGSRY